MQKQFQRLMCAVALAASVNLWAVPRTSALAPAQEEEPALYYDAYGAAFYLTPEEADTLLPDLDAEPVVVELPEEEPDPEPLPDDAEDDPPVILPQPDQTLDKMDAGFAVTSEQPEKVEEDPPEQTPAADIYEATDLDNISVTVTWGSMNFEYCSGQWDTENLCYETPTSGSAGWQPKSSGDNTITFTNSGTAAVKVNCSYESNSSSGYTSDVEFKDETQTDLFTDALYPVVQLVPEITSADEAALYSSADLAVQGTLKVEVTLTGPRPAAEMSSEKIGTITATISAVSSGTSDTTTT